MKCKFHVGDVVVVVNETSYRLGFIGCITKINDDTVDLEAKDKGRWASDTFRTYLEWIDFYSDGNEEEINAQDLSILF